MNDTLIIIPAYNEEECIEAVVRSLMSYPQYDYVIINDGSRDHTAEICRRNGFNLVDLPVNLGLAGAFQTGMRYAYTHGYKYAIQFDADGQHLPEYIEPLRSKAAEGYDIVIGSRFVESSKKASMRSLGSDLISLAIRLSAGRKIKDPTSGMRMYNERMIKLYAENINFGPEPDTLSYLIRSGASVAEVGICMADRMGGESYLTSFASMKYMMRMAVSIMLVQFSRKKLKLNSPED